MSKNGRRYEPAPDPSRLPWRVGNVPACDRLAQHLEDVVTVERNFIVCRIAEEVMKDKRSGIGVSATDVAQRVGRPLKDLLLGELKNEDTQVAETVAFGLMRYDRDLAVANAFLDRLMELDSASDPGARRRRPLFGYNGYPQIAERALPVIRDRLHNSPEYRIREFAALCIRSFGSVAIPDLIAAMETPVDLNLCTVITSLGGRANERPLVGVEALPDILKVFSWRAADYVYEFTQRTVDRIVAEAAAKSDGTAEPVSAETSARIEALIQAQSRDPKNWPDGVCMRRGALLVHMTKGLFAYGVRPDGTVIELDLDRALPSPSTVTDPLHRFSLLVRGAKRYPELAELIPAPPLGTRVCFDCKASGESPTDSRWNCGKCSGRGWFLVGK